MKTKSAWLLLLLCFCFSAASLQAAGSGTSGAVVLKHNFNPGAEAMGEAYVAVADDVQAMYWNPSGLAYLLGDQASTSFSKGLVDDFYGQISYAHAYSPDLTFAAGLLSYSAGKFELVDDLGHTADLNAQSDYLLALSGAYRIDDEFAAGATLEGLYSTLVETVSGFTAAINLGGSYKPKMFPGLRAGASIRHLGLPLKYESQADPLPLTGQIGASYLLLKSPLDKPEHDLQVAADACIGLDTKLYVNLGAEYWFRKMLAARMGYKVNRDLEWLVLGLGVKYPVLKDLPLQLDYAFSLAREFSSTHKLAVSLFLPRSQGRWTDDERLAQKEAAEEAALRKQQEEEKQRQEELAKQQAAAETQRQAEAKQKEIEAKLPPLTLQVLETEKMGGEIKNLVLNAGSKTKGVVKNAMGVIYNPGHTPIGKCKLIQIYSIRSLAQVLELAGEIDPQAVVEIIR